MKPLEIVSLYRIWTSIIYRCTRKENKQYKNYGARGITICKEWMDFNQFCRDVGKKPFEGCHLDRIDNDKGYYKENVRWTTPKTNHRNKRNNHYYDTHLGKICQSELIERMGYTRTQFRQALKKHGEEKLLALFKEGKHPEKRPDYNMIDIIGEKFGQLTVTSLDENKSTGIRYFCFCDCGNPIRVSRFKLLHNLSKECQSCTKRGNKNPNSLTRRKKALCKKTNYPIDREDIVGKFFGKWKVLKFSFYTRKTGHMYLCKCECGIEKEVARNNLMKDKTTQCRSCSAKEMHKKMKRKNK